MLIPPPQTHTHLLSLTQRGLSPNLPLALWCDCRLTLVTFADLSELLLSARTELSQLHQLTRLSLCDVAEAAPNPVCKVPGYQDRLMAAVPSLLTLNGRRTNVAEDDDFYKGADSLDKVNS